MKCRVLNCKSDSKTSECSFFHFPKDDDVARKWVQFCRQKKDFNLHTSFICMRHFTDNDIENYMQFKNGFARYRKLRRGAVPTIFEWADTLEELTEVEIHIYDQPPVEVELVIDDDELIASSSSPDENKVEVMDSVYSDDNIVDGANTGDRNWVDGNWGNGTWGEVNMDVANWCDDNWGDYILGR